MHTLLIYLISNMPFCGLVYMWRMPPSPIRVMVLTSFKWERSNFKASPSSQKFVGFPSFIQSIQKGKVKIIGHSNAFHYRNVFVHLTIILFEEGSCRNRNCMRIECMTCINCEYISLRLVPCLYYKRWTHNTEPFKENRMNLHLHLHTKWMWTLQLEKAKQIIQHSDMNCHIIGFRHSSWNCLKSVMNLLTSPVCDVKIHIINDA